MCVFYSFHVSKLRPGCYTGKTGAKLAEERLKTITALIVVDFICTADHYRLSVFSYGFTGGGKNRSGCSSCILSYWLIGRCLTPVSAQCLAILHWTVLARCSRWTVALSLSFSERRHVVTMRIRITVKACQQILMKNRSIPSG